MKETYLNHTQLYSIENGTSLYDRKNPTSYFGGLRFDSQQGGLLKYSRFSSLSRDMPGKKLQLRHHRLITHPSQFINNHLPTIIYAVDKASLK
jgi:hypothetical protein